MGLFNKFRRKEDQLTLQEEVVEHLTDFLNTKRNFGAYPTDYGIDTYVYAGSGSQVANKIIEDIQAGLGKYEKRVQQLDIKNIPSKSSFQLCFKIQCEVNANKICFQLSFHHQKQFFEAEDNL